MFLTAILLLIFSSSMAHSAGRLRLVEWNCWSKSLKSSFTG